MQISGCYRRSPEIRKAKAWTKNGKIEDLRQSWKQEKRSQKNDKDDPREGAKMKVSIISTSLSLDMMDIHILI